MLFSRCRKGPPLAPRQVRGPSRDGYVNAGGRQDLVSSGGTQRVFQDGDKAVEVGVLVSLGCVTNTTRWAVSITDSYFLTVPEAGSPG